MKKNNALPPNEKRVDVYYGRKSTGRNSEDEEAEKADRQAASLGRQRGTFDDYYNDLPVAKKTKKLVRIEEAKSAFVPGKRDGFNEVIRIADNIGINYLYIDEPKRISRNHEECGKIAQLLADGADQDNSFVGADERKVAYERRLSNEVEQIVTSIVGPGRARVRLSAAPLGPL